MKLKLIAIIIGVMMAIGIVGADTATMSVTVGNSDPTVDNIWIDGEDAGATITPNMGSTVTIPIRAQVSDENGHDDITSVTVEIKYANGTIYKSGISLIKTTYIDDTTYDWEDSFTMDYYDSPEIYTVKVTANDGTGTGFREETFTYNTLLALDVDNDAITFTAANPGDTRYVLGDDIFSEGDTEPTIDNLGNVIMDVAMSGTDLDGIAPNTITVDNAGYRFDSGSYIALTTGAITNDINIVIQGTNKIDFELNVPLGTPVDTYSGTVTITAS